MNGYDLPYGHSLPVLSVAFRPRSSRIRQLLRQGEVDVVFAYAVDRLYRNQNHIDILFDEAEQAGARLEFVTKNFDDNAISKLFFATRAFVGDLESACQGVSNWADQAEGDDLGLVMDAPPHPRFFLVNQALDPGQSIFLMADDRLAIPVRSEPYRYPGESRDPRTALDTGLRRCDG